MDWLWSKTSRNLVFTSSPNLLNWAPGGGSFWLGPDDAESGWELSALVANKSLKSAGDLIPQRLKRALSFQTAGHGILERNHASWSLFSPVVQGILPPTHNSAHLSTSRGFRDLLWLLAFSFGLPFAIRLLSLVCRPLLSACSLAFVQGPRKWLHISLRLLIAPPASSREDTLFRGDHLQSLADLIAGSPRL